MHHEHSRAGLGAAALPCLGLALALLTALNGCSLLRAVREEPPVAMPAIVAPSPEPSADLEPQPEPAPPAPAVAVPEPPRPGPVEIVLDYSDRIRGLQPADVTQEITRIGDAGNSPVRLTQLAIALLFTKQPPNTQRAQALLQRVLNQKEPDAVALHSLVRLISVQLAETRREEEQLDRLSQQLRDAQRRNDQLNERLEAVRAIERSLPTRPASAVSGAASAPASAASAPAAPRP